MRTTVLLVGLCVLAASARRLDRSSESSEDTRKTLVKPFASGYEYKYLYDAQVSSGFSQEVSEQNAVARIQADVRIRFDSQDEAVLRMNSVRFGQLNDEIETPKRMAPMRKFEEKDFSQATKNQLRLPIRFTIRDGKVDEIQFHHEDTAWSKNVKRGILNMLQLNLNGKDAEELRDEQRMPSTDLKNSRRSFTLQETTLEGLCPTTYTIVEPQEGERSEEQAFNVTKSIEFSKCMKAADVAYGFQTGSLQAECALRKQGLEQVSPLCDSKVVKANKIDRSTVLRYVVRGNAERYAIEHAEVLSQYVVKNLKMEAKRASMYVTAIGQLTYQDAVQEQKKDDETFDENKESLMYSSEWDLAEKRFYMLGDEEYGRDAPFKQVGDKPERISNLLREISTGMETHEMDENAMTARADRVAEYVRMCTKEELKQVAEKIIRSDSTPGSKLSEQAQDKIQKRMKDLFYDSLAVAGTQNTIKFLADKISNKEISVAKAISALKALHGLPAPSKQQVDTVLGLCQSWTVKESAPLKQTCWLTFGSMVSELCEQKPGVSAQVDEDICPQQIKDSYSQTLVQECTSAEHMYEKVLAMKALGNAGLKESIPHFISLIEDRTEQPIIRALAIDGLRRLRMRVPRKIQRLLMPVFENTEELSEIRMAAFSMILQTLPEQDVVDQLVYKLAKDDGEQIKAFVYSTLKTMAASPLPAERKLAHHLRSSLMAVNYENEKLRWSRRYSMPLYNQHLDEGLILNMASVFSNRTALPVHLAASFDALLNNELERQIVKLSITQTDIDWMLENITAPYFGRHSEREQRHHAASKKSLIEMFRGLFTKARRDDMDDPFGMAVVRVADYDRWILPLAERNLPEEVQKAIRGEGETFNLRKILSALNGQFRMSLMTSLGEKSAKIPTSVGLPVRFHQAAPILASIDSSIKSAADDELNVKATLKPQVIVGTVHIAEVWTPLSIVGVSNTRTIGARVPIALKVAKANGEIVAKIETPTKNIRLLGFQTLPATFTLELDPETSLPSSSRGVKSIHNRNAEHRLHDLNLNFGNHLRLPIAVFGRYHVPQRFTAQDAIDTFSTTENHVHIEYQPSNDSPTHLALSANMKLFEESTNAQPKFEKLFNGAAKFEHIYPEEYDDFNMDNNNERESKVRQFVERYEVKKAYKHKLAVTAKTMGGQRDITAQASIELTCEATPGYCRAAVETAHITPKDKWTMEADGEMILPLGVSDAERLEEMPSKQNRFVAQMQAMWGAEKNERQSVNVRVIGSPAMSRQWRALESEHGKGRKEIQKLTRFINHYDLVAEYELLPSTMNTAIRFQDMLKSYAFWNTEAHFVHSADGQLKANLLIDPITRQHMNVSVQTPTQKFRIDSYPLPVKMGPLPLIRQQNTPKQSAWDFVASAAMTSGAQCKIDEHVKTFDGVTIDAPLPPCYIVVAKDCARDEPRYAVLMKQASKGSNNKAMKVVVESATIEVEPERDGKLKVKQNGRRISEDDDNEYIHFVSKHEVLVTIRGMEVRFDGNKASIRSSVVHKNGVCGSCGHYDGESRDELRMPNNEMASDVREFHRSYVLSNNDCDKKQLEDFYGRSKFEMAQSSENFDDYFDRPQRREQSKNAEDGEESDPESQTKVLEYNHKVCFSLEPIDDCKRGIATGRTIKKTVSFVCFNRTTLEANRLLREYRKRGVVDVSEYPESLSSEIFIPTRCVIY